MVEINRRSGKAARRSNGYNDGLPSANHLKILLFAGPGSHIYVLDMQCKYEE